MFMRRALILGGILLVLFLAMYSWNRRTRALDQLATNIGLEVSSWILTPLRTVQELTGDFWDKYVDLVDVRGENLRLKAHVKELEARLVATGEDLAELKRLRELVQFPVDARWRPLAARVLAGRMGPNGVLDSITISRGYVSGAKPGIPLVTNMGLVGRVLRSSPHASTVLLISDPGSRVAVFGQESRAPGILKGRGMGRPLEVDFVQRDAGIKNGEVLVTSGLDDKYPKGLPVARVTEVAPSDYTQFMAVSATPLVDLQHIEEVLLLEKSGYEPAVEDTDAPAPVLVGPPVPPHLTRKQVKGSDSSTEAVNSSPENGVPQASHASTVTVRQSAGTPEVPRYKVIVP